MLRRRSKKVFCDKIGELFCGAGGFAEGAKKIMFAVKKALKKGKKEFHTIMSG